MSEGYWDRYTRATMTAYHKRRNLLMECLQHEMGSKIEIFGGTAGLHLLVATRWPLRVRGCSPPPKTAGVRVPHQRLLDAASSNRPLRKMRACGLFEHRTRTDSGRRASPRAGVVPLKNNAANANGSQGRCPFARKCTKCVPLTDNGS